MRVAFLDPLEERLIDFPKQYLAKHEVLTVGPGGEGKILEVLEDGYELHGRVIRPAKVRVGSGETPPPSPQNS